MYTPHKITLYRITEGATEPVVNITVLHSCHLQRTEAASANTRGYAGASSATLFIPFDVFATDGLTGAPKVYASPKEATENDYTICDDGTCFFVLGEHVVPNATFKAINATYDDCYKITGVRVCDYGSGNMRHFEVSGA